MSIEAMKLALEALDDVPTISGYAVKKLREVENILRAAIEQAEDAVAAERWACAKTCEEAGTDENGQVHLIAWECAAAIRVRGNNAHP
jgi:hypothetical protein